MKITPQQLASHLNQSQAAIYIVSGDEILLVQETLDIIRKAFHERGFCERTRIPVESGNEWGNVLYNTAYSLSLFSNKKILELNFSTAKFNQNTTRALQDYAEKPAADTVLFIQTEKIDSKMEQAKWFQVIEKNNIFIPIWPIPQQQLPQWIIQRAKQIGLTITSDAATFLATQVEGNLLAAAQEIEKFKLLDLSQTIDRTLMETAVTDNARFDVFDLVENAVSGHSERALRIIKNLAAEDIEPTLVLWAITRELRMLADMHAKQKQGVPLTTLFSQYRIWEKRQPAIRAFLKRHTQENCWNFLLNAAEIDRIIKGAEKGNAWNALECWAMKISL